MIAAGNVCRRRNEGGPDVGKTSFPTTNLIFQTELGKHQLKATENAHT